MLLHSKSNNVPALMAMILKQASKALHGDSKAALYFFESARESDREKELKAQERSLTEEDEEILAEFLRQNREDGGDGDE